MNPIEITKNFWWVGTLDPELRIFDILLTTDIGTSYNSYLLKDSKKNVLFDATKAFFTDEYIKALESVIPVSEIDILVVSHTEPDHSGAIGKLLDMNPGLDIYATMGGLNLMKEIVNREFNGVCIKDGEEIDTGEKTLRFITAPNLHWPDTMFTYIPEDKILVTCDAFGAHYAHDSVVFDDKIDKEKYLDEARYYFDNIMGPFIPDVLKALDKIEGLEIDTIANGHGPVLTEDPGFIIELYHTWASEPAKNEKKTVVIPYVSAYGYTKMLAEKIAEGINAAGDIDVKLYDMVHNKTEDVIKEIGMADGFLLGTPTLVGEALPPIWNITSSLNPRIHGGRFAGVFGSYGWSGEGVPHIMDRLKQLKMRLVGEGFRVRFKPSEDELIGAYEYGKLFGTAVETDTLPE
jgi:flavorubredoxin